MWTGGEGSGESRSSCRSIRGAELSPGEGSVSKESGGPSADTSLINLSLLDELPLLLGFYSRRVHRIWGKWQFEKRLRERPQFLTFWRGWNPRAGPHQHVPWSEAHETQLANGLLVGRVGWVAGRWVGRRRETDSSTEPVGGLHPPHPGKLCTLLRGVRRASMSPLQRLPRSRCTGSGQGSWGSWVVPLLPMGNRILYYQRFLYDLPSQGFGAAPVNICTCFLAQFSSVSQLCPTLCDPMDCSTPGFPVHYQLPELTQTHVHRVGDAIQPSHPLLSPSSPAFNLF